MEFRRLTEQDLPSLLELLIWPCHMPKRRIVIRLFFKAESPDQMHIVFTKIKDLMEV